MKLRVHGSSTRSRRGIVVVAAAISLMGVVVAEPAIAATHASVSPKEPRPDCGDTVYLTSQQYSGGKWSFKIVGTGLSKWLGSSHGTMHYQAAVLGSTVQKQGQVNATSSAGARTSTITISVSSGHTGTVEAEIYKGNYQACTTQFERTF